MLVSKKEGWIIAGRLSGALNLSLSLRERAG
jgi:hypothetical protein